MPILDSPEPALARWLAHGITSRTHPVLRCALETFLHPLGIEAEPLEAEPFSALESGLGEWWLRQPRWNPGRFDRGHPASRDFGLLLERPDYFVVTVDSKGALFPSLGPAASDVPAARAFIEVGDESWRAIRHTIRAAHDAETFLYAAAGLLLANDPVAGLYAAGDDAGFCDAVLQRARTARAE